MTTENEIQEDADARAAKMLGDCARRTLEDLADPDRDVRKMAERNRQIVELAMVELGMMIDGEYEPDGA